jgi:hypothetical protein
MVARPDQAVIATPLLLEAVRRRASEGRAREARTGRSPPEREKAPVVAPPSRG